MIDQEQREYILSTIAKFIANYKLDKEFKGEGLKSQSYFWNDRSLWAILLGLAVLGFILLALGNSFMLSFAPFFITWFGYVFGIKPKEILKPFMIWNYPKEFSQFEPRFNRVSDEAKRLAVEVGQVNLSEEELSLFLQLATFAPIYGKERIKKVLPQLLEHDNLANLEFIQEMARDLKVRIN